MNNDSLDCEVPVTKSMEIEIKQLINFLEIFKIWETVQHPREDIKLDMDKFKELRDNTDWLRSEYASFYAQTLIDNDIEDLDS